MAAFGLNSVKKLYDSRNCCTFALSKDKNIIQQLKHL